MVSVSILSCKEASKESTAKVQNEVSSAITYANGFSLHNYGDYKIIKVKQPWPDATNDYTYALINKGAQLPSNIEVDQKITVPLERIVVTSTTHIPSLEMLGEINKLVGFPNLAYISSKQTRQHIDEGKITELGANESINTEVLLALSPDVVVGFAIDSDNKTYSTIENNGIPVLYNADWLEKHPLGKAEWLKFFGALFNKEKMADSLFTSIEKSYKKTKNLAQKASKKPSVISGALYRDVWYLPYGNSWQAKFIDDAHANYIYSEQKGQGSIALAFEDVLDQAQHADFWISPGNFSSYDEMENATAHYEQFDAFINKAVYSFSGVKGETGGVLFYELAPNRPDLVLKDMVSIFHPSLLPDYETTFFKALD